MIFITRVLVHVLHAALKTLWTSSRATVMPTKSDSDVVLCLQLLSKKLNCTLYLSECESIDHLCINPILRIG